MRIVLPATTLCNAKIAKFFTYLFFCCAVLIQFTAYAEASQTTVLAARIGGDDERTRFVIDLSHATAYSTKIMTGPDRVVVELGEATFSLPPGAGQKLRGLVKKFTYGAEEKGYSKIVVETTSPVTIANAFTIAPHRKQPARLVFDLVKSVAVEELPAIPVVETPQPVITGTRKVIVIDPGHGGADPGAVSPRSVQEKDVVLAFGKALQRALEARGGYTIFLTRQKDEFLTLRDRVDLAREKSANLFIAVHADTVHGNGARGTTLYTLSDKASDAEAEALAHKENRSDIIAGVDLGGEKDEVADVLIDLAQRESKSLALTFAARAASSLKQVTLMTKKPIRSAGFVVLKAPDIPSVLVELGYLSSKQDEALMVSDDWQKNTAEAMASAIEQFFATDALVLPVAASP